MKKKFIEKTNFKESVYKKIVVDYVGLPRKQVPLANIDTNPFTNYPDKNILLSVSRFEIKKGYKEMYKIFTDLINKDNNNIWIIIGKGSYEQEFKQLVKKDKMGKYIKFIGYINNNELGKYYKYADVFWLLSECKEAFGLVYLEAQGYRCPAIGYNYYGVSEAIINKKTGFLVKNTEECLRILSNKEYKKLIKADIVDHAYSYKSKLNELINKVIQQDEK
jgi:glycosyltransferase involved in cell wall biosynthesis